MSGAKAQESTLKRSRKDHRENKWVSTCNYWATRTSKEPLVGGVSNMEYGWNHINKPAHGPAQLDTEVADIKWGQF
ncbi:hypothetical protein C8F04DRAFT_1305673 [Mycena alexandri]|uniref:Uncharacterized protein n=1 Tax=Mycena alexandri TaxID=1745969 RepID=A0AAD6T9J7_9AGAR|nr:hypothetical protein C8F04DRAFT_1305673 [Mycena alexandri]